MTRDDLDRALAEGECIRLGEEYDGALLGLCYQFGRGPVALYSRQGVVDVLRAMGMDEDEAEEFFDYNIIGAYAGDTTPAFCDLVAR